MPNTAKANYTTANYDKQSLLPARDSPGARRQEALPFTKES